MKFQCISAFIYDMDNPENHYPNETHDLSRLRLKKENPLEGFTTTLFVEGDLETFINEYERFKKRIIARDWGFLQGASSVNYLLDYFFEQRKRPITTLLKYTIGIPNMFVIGCLGWVPMPIHSPFEVHLKARNLSHHLAVKPEPDFEKEADKKFLSIIAKKKYDSQLIPAPRATVDKNYLAIRAKKPNDGTNAYDEYLLKKNNQHTFFKTEQPSSSNEDAIQPTNTAQSEVHTLRAAP